MLCYESGLMSTLGDNPIPEDPFYNDSVGDNE
jgi:hypothetical protein